MKERWYNLGLAAMGIAFISVGGQALYEWHETGQIALHRGFHRTVAYAADPYLFAYEFGGNVLLIILGLAAFAGAIYETLSRWGRRSR
jgi:hypothetical protein